MKINEWYRYESKKINGFIVKEFDGMTNAQIIRALIDFLATYRPEGETIEW